MLAEHEWELEGSLAEVKTSHHPSLNPSPMGSGACHTSEHVRPRLQLHNFCGKSPATSSTASEKCPLLSVLKLFLEQQMNAILMLYLQISLAEPNLKLQYSFSFTWINTPDGCSFHPDWSIAAECSYTERTKVRLQHLHCNMLRERQLVFWTKTRLQRHMYVEEHIEHTHTHSCKCLSWPSTPSVVHHTQVAGLCSPAD